MSFSINVEKERFKFNCAHFIAYEGFRERLHGHNYQVGVRLDGTRRGHDGYVLDFGIVKETVIKICKDWNEKFICPVKSDVLEIDMESNELNVSMNCKDGSFFSFPKDDCLFLPIVHSSAEELAEYFCGLLIEKLTIDLLKDRGITSISVKVAEAPNQEAIYTMDLTNANGVLPDDSKPRPLPKPCLAQH